MGFINGFYFGVPKYLCSVLGLHYNGVTSEVFLNYVYSTIHNEREGGKERKKGEGI